MRDDPYRMDLRTAAVWAIGLSPWIAMVIWLR